MKFALGLPFVLIALLTTCDATDYVVVTNSDSGPGSLRQAILDANANGGGTVTFSNVIGLIVLSKQLPILTNNMQILGPGADQLAIQGPGVITNALGTSVVISGLEFTNSGTAIANVGTMILSNCTIANCSRGGPGPSQYAPVYNTGTLMATRCAIFGCNAFYGKDGVAIHNSGTMSLEFCGITNNGGSFVEGCGIYNEGNLTADYCTIANNGIDNGAGAGIFNYSGAIVLRNCSVTGNAAFEAGGIWNNAWLAMTNCTLAQNAAYYSDGPQRAGGLFNQGYAVLQNTTVSQNAATPGGYGAGIWNDGLLLLFNATVASNHVGGSYCEQPPTGAGVWNSGVVRSWNSIIAGNTRSPVCSSLGFDFAGNLDSLGHNLIQDGTGWTNVGTGTGDIIGVDPMLGPLQDNGGPTWTHALLPGSPAIDAGDTSQWSIPKDDQRGVARPQRLAVDIGAFEYQCTVPVFIEADGHRYMNFQFCGMPVTSYSIQASTNLVTWEDIVTATTGEDGLAGYSDPFGYPRRFYRVKAR
jgi:hypothetical protein